MSLPTSAPPDIQKLAPGLPKSPRKIKHRTPKQFGRREDKWARGGGSQGYARAYGRHTSRHNPTRAEALNAAERAAGAHEGASTEQPLL